MSESRGELLPVEYSFLTRETLGADYERVCALADLEPTEGGWALLHCVRDNGERVTAVDPDVEYLKLLRGANLADLVLPVGKFSRVRAGWPDEWGRGNRQHRRARRR